MNKTAIDFQAIMLKPLVITGMRQVKTMTPDAVRQLVRAHHPASKAAHAHDQAEQRCTAK